MFRNVYFFYLKWLYAILAHSQNPQLTVTLANTYLQISLMVIDIQIYNILWASWPLAPRLVVPACSRLT